MLLLLNPGFLVVYLISLVGGLPFGIQNAKELSLLDLDFAVRVRIWLLLVKWQLGIDLLIIDGKRSDAEQAALHAQDSRNPEKAGDHGAGRAVDVRAYRAGKVLFTKSSPSVSWLPIYRLAAACGIANGSRFTGYPDNNHFFRRPGDQYFLSLLKIFSS